MIIECINCNKLFEVNSELIPENGRTIQCGICNHIWFYKPKIKDNREVIDKPKKIEKTQISKEIQNNDKKSQKIKSKYSQKNKELTIIKKQSKFSFSKVLSYFFVLIISFIGLIIVLDTLKSPLSNIFPGLELILYNLFESIKDMFLFIKDLSI